MKLSAGISLNGDYKSTLYRCATKYRDKRKRYFVFIERVDGKEELTELGNGLIVKAPRIEYLDGDDWEEWYKCHQLRPA